ISASACIGTKAEEETKCIERNGPAVVPPLCVPKIRFCNIDDEDHEDGSRCNGAGALNCPMERRIFVERVMNSRHIIIGSILPKDPTEVRLPENDQVVETFPSDRADQSLRVCILPRRARGNGLVADAHGS